MKWKQNWPETRQHFVDWWNHQGLVITINGISLPVERRHEFIEKPADAASLHAAYTNAEQRAKRNHFALSSQAYPGDTLPISITDIGPGSLALFCGSQPRFSNETVWFDPCMHTCTEPENLASIRFDESNTWWIITENILMSCAELAYGKYLVGCPDLIENLDILASLRGTQNVLMDLLDRPHWVEQKIYEINQVWFAAYQRIYEIIALEDGSSAFGAFHLWGPGTTAKVQCDAAAMLSPQLFDTFVLPALTEQCQWLDWSMYHLDGTQAMVHLDSLLSIDALDAIEWTPQAGIESGGRPRWYPLYRKILNAGKSVQAVDIHKDEVLPLLDAIGGKGVYIITHCESMDEAEEILAAVEGYK
jgi:hypothetical protein